MKYKVEHPTMKIEKDGNIVNGSGVPITSIKITTLPCDRIDLTSVIDGNTICKIFKEIDWEYLLGTGHWTPRMNDIIYLTPELLKSNIIKLMKLWEIDSKKNAKFSQRVYSGIYSYYYTFTLNVIKGKFSYTIKFN